MARPTGQAGVGVGVVGMQHGPPLPSGAVIWEGFGVCVWRRSSVLMVAVSEQQLETELAAGALSCPGCFGRLARWGFARPREVRMLAGVRSVQPRRACCGGCGATHVL